MAIIPNGSIIDVKFEGNTAVILCSNYSGGSTATAKVIKSTNYTSWTDVTTSTSGTFFELGLSSATKSFAVFLGWSGTTVTADYLKEITSLSSVANNTAGGSRLWQCVDIDNFSGANDYILAGYDGGLLRSNDGGTNWTSL
jgi:ABC-type proline/glycine betaine transport system substrate-binding protein